MQYSGCRGDGPVLAATKLNFVTGAISAGSSGRTGDETRAMVHHGVDADVPLLVSLQGLVPVPSVTK